MYNCFENFSLANEITTFYFSFCFTRIYNGLAGSTLWTTEYNDTRFNHAELTDRGTYFHWTVGQTPELTVSKQNPQC